MAMLRPRLIATTACALAAAAKGTYARSFKTALLYSRSSSPFRRQPSAGIASAASKNNGRHAVHAACFQFPPLLVSQKASSFLSNASVVGFGAVAGAVSRYQIGNIVAQKIAQFPRLSYFQGWHTAGINILGSFILGTLAGLPTVDSVASHGQISITARTRLMAGVGFCGSFTTFSTFCVDIVGMLSKGEISRAFTYMALNNLGGIMAAFAGFNVAKRIMTG